MQQYTHDVVDAAAAAAAAVPKFIANTLAHTEIPFAHVCDVRHIRDCRKEIQNLSGTRRYKDLSK